MLQRYKKFVKHYLLLVIFFLFLLSDMMFLPFNSEVENKGGENQVRKIRFGGVGVGKIYHVVGNKGYWSSKARYYTIEDAIIAEYVYLKYNKVRQKGRMVGIFY